MGVPWGCLFIKLKLSKLQQYRELQLAFYKKTAYNMTDHNPKKSLTDHGRKKYFFWPSPIPFYPFYKVGVEIPQIYTESDKLSFYKAPPGHLIRTKTVQTWFLRDSPGMFFSVCAGKTCNYQRNCLYCKDLQSKCTL